MKVIYSGHEKVLMTDYNGKRYCFEKGIPQEVPSEVYDEILLSGHVDAIDLKPVEIPEEKPVITKEETKEAQQEIAKPRGRPKGKKR